MATISRQHGYAQGINLTGAYAWLMIYVPLRFVKQHQSEILHPVRLDEYLCVRTVKSLATMFTDCYSI